MDLMHSRCRMKSFCRNEWWFNTLENANKRSSEKLHLLSIFTLFYIDIL